MKVENELQDIPLRKTKEEKREKERREKEVDKGISKTSQANRSQEFGGMKEKKPMRKCRDHSRRKEYHQLHLTRSIGSQK